LGPNGAGKSTLLNTLMGRFNMHKGTHILFKDKDEDITNKGIRIALKCDLLSFLWDGIFFRADRPTEFGGCSYGNKKR
jgi:ABC-type Mn2+/Zn2+ transport system ATPase subunit